MMQLTTPPKVPERQEAQEQGKKKRSPAEQHRGKPLKLTLKPLAKMGTGLINIQQQQELARLASAVVPLQRLNLGSTETYATMVIVSPASPEEPETQ